jgi:hypothetical protein
MSAQKKKRVPVGRDGRPIVEAETTDEVERDLEDDLDEDCDCPRLDPDDWDRVESDWSDIAFIKGTSTAVLGVPTGFASTRSELIRRAENLGATVPEDAMALIGAGQFRRPVWLEVEDAPEDKEIVRPGGVAFTRLVQAPLGVIKRVVGEAESDARERYGRHPDAVWLWYLTCRACSRARNFETLVVAHYRDHT